jgi:adenylylsulfate kinase
VSGGAVVWLTGLPASGKSTLAAALAADLRGRGVAVAVLDGDEVRGALSPAPGYDEGGRDDFYRTLAQLAALLAAQGLVVVVPATAARRAFRHRARALAPRFVEVFVATSAAECAARDPRGLWRQHAAGALPALPDAASYEPPEAPDVVARGGDGDAVLAAIRAALGVE